MIEDDFETRTMATITVPDHDLLARKELAEIPTWKLLAVKQEPVSRPARRGVSLRADTLAIALLCLADVLLIVAIVLLWLSH